MNLQDVRERLRFIQANAMANRSDGIESDNELHYAVDLFVEAFRAGITLHHDDVREMALSTGWGDEQATKLAETADVVHLTGRRFQNLGLVD